MLYIAPGLLDLFPPSSSVVTSPAGFVGNASAQGFIRVFESHSEVLSFLDSLYSQAWDSVIGPAAPIAPPRMVTPSMPLASGSGVSAGYSYTNVQVAGVDEIDPVKSDGRVIVVSSGDRVYIVDISRSSLASVITLRGSARGVFLWDSYLVILVGIGPAPLPMIPGRVSIPLFYPYIYGNTSVYVYDISSPSRPVQRFLLEYSGFLSGARMVNGSIYLVLSSPSRPGFIPSINGSPISASKIYLVDPVPSSYATIASIDIAGGGHSEISLLISSTSWIYMSPSRLYIVSYRGYIDAHISALTALARYLPGDLGSRVYSEALSGNISGALRLVESYLASLDLDSARSIVSKASGDLSASSFQDSSRVLVIDVRGSSLSYRGYIDIPGSLMDQFSIEERGDYLVLGTTSRNATLSIGLLEALTRIPLSRSVGIRVTECSSTCVERIVSIEATAIPAQKPRISIYMNPVPSGNMSNNVIIASLDEMKIKGLLENLASGERIYAARLPHRLGYACKPSIAGLCEKSPGVYIAHQRALIIDDIDIVPLIARLPRSLDIYILRASPTVMSRWNEATMVVITPPTLSGGYLIRRAISDAASLGRILRSSPLILGGSLSMKSAASSTGILDTTLLISSKPLTETRSWIIS